MKSTIFILGPGGVGKSNLENLFSKDVIKINPYRLRPKGPRKEKKNRETGDAERDLFYAHTKLKNEFEDILNEFGDIKQCLDEDTIWYRKSKVLIFNVRGTWQILPLIREVKAGSDKLAKAEIYVSVLPHILTNSEFNFFGKPRIIILNPSPKKILDIEDINELKEITKVNLKKRKTDDLGSIQKRIGSISEEFEIWKTLLKNPATNDKTIEYVNWGFPEYLYSELDSEKVLDEAKKCLLNKNPELGMFFKS